MTGTFETLKKPYRGFKSRLNLFLRVNWLKSVYFNFKKFPFDTAIKLPVLFYGSVKLHAIDGEFRIEAPISMGMIGFGQRFELITRSQGVAEFYLSGTIVCKGHVHFGQDYLIYVGENALCEFGHMFGMGSRGKIICYQKMSFGNYVRIGYESQVIDSNFHQMIDLSTNTKLAMTSPISLGDYNWVGNRSSVMSKAKTPNYCMVASNSLCNKDYSELGSHVMIGGIPSKLLRKDISRDWEGEREDMDRWLMFGKNL